MIGAILAFNLKTRCPKVQKRSGLYAGGCQVVLGPLPFFSVNPVNPVQKFLRLAALPGPSLRYGSIRKLNCFMASSSMTPSLTIASVVKSLNVAVDFAQSVFSPL